VQQKLASGFNRNHMIDYEGRAIPEEYRVEYVADSQQPTKPSQGHPAKDPAKEPSQGAQPRSPAKELLTRSSGRCYTCHWSIQNNWI